MDYSDRTLVCKDCGKEFVFTVGEQKFFAEQKFENDPKRCQDCRFKRQDEERRRRMAPREMHIAVCAQCGGEARVPFAPSGDRPVYCSECFAKMFPRSR